MKLLPINTNNNQQDYVYLFCKVQIAVLVANEALNSISIEYSDFANVLSLELALELFEDTRINNHAIELVDDWQILFRPIYSLELVELEILKTYIKTNLANSFIRPFKFSVRALFFVTKNQIKASNFVLITKDSTAL